MKRILALVLALTMALCLVACGGNEEEGLKVGVFYYTYDDTYIASVRAALDSELNAMGVSYTNYDCKNDQATQNDYVTTAITNGCNLLIVNLVNSGKADAAKKILELAGDVPVIFFNRAVEGDGEEGKVLGAFDNACFIGTDAPEAGHMQGKMVGDYVLANFDKLDLNKDGKISYAMFKGEEGNAEAIYRTQFGVEDADKVLTAAGKPALEYFDAANTSKYQVDQKGAWSTEAALNYMTTNLASFNETNNNMIELVICNNDGMAEGVVQALVAAGYNLGTADCTTIPVFGVDATASAQELIRAGKMTGTVKQDAEGMAKAIAQTVKGVSEGTALVTALAAVANSSDIYSLAEGVASKLYVAYAPFTA